MARIRFRLEAKLKLAQYALDNAQGLLAEELHKLEECNLQFNQQELCLSEALKMQRDAALNSPQDLGICLMYVLKEQTRLTQCKIMLQEQEDEVAIARTKVTDAYQEVKKFERLKSKQLQLFLAEQLKKEQSTIDETGQVLFNRRRTITFEE